MSVAGAMLGLLIQAAPVAPAATPEAFALPATLATLAAVDRAEDGSSVTYTTAYRQPGDPLVSVFARVAHRTSHEDLAASLEAQRTLGTLRGGSALPMLPRCPDVVGWIGTGSVDGRSTLTATLTALRGGRNIKMRATVAAAGGDELMRAILTAFERESLGC